MKEYMEEHMKEYKKKREKTLLCKMLVLWYYYFSVNYV